MACHIYTTTHLLARLLKCSPSEGSFFSSAQRTDVNGDDDDANETTHGFCPSLADEREQPWRVNSSTSGGLLRGVALRCKVDLHNKLEGDSWVLEGKWVEKFKFYFYF